MSSSSQNDQVLLADTVTYNQRTDTVTASGHVSMHQPTGDVVFADYMELREISATASSRSAECCCPTARASPAIPRGASAATAPKCGARVYSPCELCAARSDRPPVWQIKAEDAVDDKELQIVEYHDAIMEIEGVPVM